MASDTTEGRSGGGRGLCGEGAWPAAWPLTVRQTLVTPPGCSEPWSPETRAAGTCKGGHTGRQKGTARRQRAAMQTGRHLRLRRHGQDYEVPRGGEGRSPGVLGFPSPGTGTGTGRTRWRPQKVSRLETAGCGGPGWPTTHHPRIMIPGCHSEPGAAGRPGRELQPS